MKFYKKQEITASIDPMTGKCYITSIKSGKVLTPGRMLVGQANDFLDMLAKSDYNKFIKDNPGKEEMSFEEFKEQGKAPGYVEIKNDDMKGLMPEVEHDPKAKETVELLAKQAEDVFSVMQDDAKQELIDRLAERYAELFRWFEATEVLLFDAADTSQDVPMFLMTANLESFMSKLKSMVE